MLNVGLYQKSNTATLPTRYEESMGQPILLIMVLEKLHYLNLPFIKIGITCKRILIHLNKEIWKISEVKILYCKNKFT